MLEALVESPSAAMRASTSATRASGTPEKRKFCQTVRRISPSPHWRAIAAISRICSVVSLPTGSTTPTQFNPACFCGCTPRCAKRSVAGRGAMSPAATRVERAAELLLDGRQELLEAPGIEHIFQPSLVAVGTVAVLDEDAHDRVRHRDAVLRRAHDSGVAGDVAVARNAAEHDAHPDAPLDARPVAHLDGLEADVVRLLEHRHDAGAVERDVELARQPVERAVVEDVEVPGAGKRPRIDQLLRVDSRRRRAGDVADVVGAGAARAQPEILNAFEQRDRVLGRDLTDLKVGAGRHMGIAAAVGSARSARPANCQWLRMPFGMRSRHMNEFWFGAT